MNKLIIAICVGLFLISPDELNGQEFPNNPVRILHEWDYYQLIEELGDGEPIIDTMAGQAYIAGMRYQENWLGRGAEVSYYFNETDISTFNVRFFSSLNMQRAVVFENTGMVQSDTLSQEMLKDTSYLSRIKDRSKRINEDIQKLYDLDSIRCDSIIQSVSGVLGEPYEQDSTLHTEASARWFAIWINRGYAASLKDYTAYTDVSFSIPHIPKQKAVALRIDENYIIYQKLKKRIENQIVDVSVLCLPEDDLQTRFKEAFLFIEPKKGPIFTEKLVEDVTFFEPHLFFTDLDGNGQDEGWFRAYKDDERKCQIDQIYLMESMEPIFLFDSEVDLYEATEGRLMNGFQAELILSDGSKFVFPLEDLKSLVGIYYSSSGALTSDEGLVPGCLKSMEIVQSANSNQLVQSTFDLLTTDSGKIIGQAVISWKLDSGYWIVEDYYIQNK